MLWTLLRCGPALMLAWLAACGDPCRDLCDRICSCEPSAPLRQDCRRQSAQREGRFQAPKSAADRARGRERCAELLDSCSCRALAEGNLSACGLAPAAVPP